MKFRPAGLSNTPMVAFPLVCFIMAHFPFYALSKKSVFNISCNHLIMQSTRFILSSWRIIPNVFGFIITFNLKETIIVCFLLQGSRWTIQAARMNMALVSFLR